LKHLTRFEKGDNIFALLSSSSSPHTLLPIRGKVVDLKWDPDNPKYLVKISAFYDNYRMLKKHIFDNLYHYSLEDKARRYPFEREHIKNREQLIDRMNQADKERFYCVIDSFMAVSSKAKLRELFNRVQFYIISKHYKLLMEAHSRPLYTGLMKVDGSSEWQARFKRSWADKFEDGDIKIDEYLSNLS
jgi:hypothetical protein